MSSLCWFSITVGYLCVETSIYFCILAQIIAGMWIGINKRNNNLLLHKLNELESLGDKLMKFYHSINFQKGLNNPLDITRNFCEHILTITDVSLSFVWLTPQEEANGSIFVTPENKLLEERIANELEKIWNNIQNEEATMLQLTDSWYYLVPIKTPVNFYGFIGLLWDENINAESKERLLKNIKILEEWSSIIYERVFTENKKAKSMVQEEQRRIGEEIHDLISGRLFGAVCATSVLTRSTNVDGKDREQLRLIASTVNQALSELRSIIYSLEATSNEQWFGHQIKRYLNEVAKIHEISVTLQISEESICIRGQQARALFRIICEATNNAVEHGHCKNLSIELTKKGAELHLTITDDGIGFEPINCPGKHQGLGLSNITKLARSMNTFITIESHLGQGTLIRIVAPNENVNIKNKLEEEAS